MHGRGGKGSPHNIFLPPPSPPPKKSRTFFYETFRRRKRFFYAPSRKFHALLFFLLHSSITFLLTQPPTLVRSLRTYVGSKFLHRSSVGSLFRVHCWLGRYTNQLEVAKVGIIPSWLVCLFPLLAFLKHSCHFFPINHHKKGVRCWLGSTKVRKRENEKKRGKGNVHGRG